jgi:Fe-S cluster assembly protein SufD
MAVRAQRRAQTGPLERILAEFESAVAHLPESVVARAARRRAAEQLRQLGWPSHDEQWRYFSLRALDRVGTFIAAGTEAGAPSAAASQAALQELALPPSLPGFERRVYVDGMQLSDGARPVQPRALEPSWLPEQRLGFLGDMFALDAAVLRVSGAAAIELVFVTSARASGTAVYPRLQLELAPDSRVTLVERHLGTPPALTLVCATVTAELARGAQLAHYRLQQCGPETLFCDTLTARLHDDAHYRVRQVAVGASAGRTSARIRLAGMAAAASWHAIAVGRGEQVHDCMLKVELAAPRTRSDEVFRGIADARARVAFSGHIHVEPSAPGAEARQSLRGLIEAEGEVDLRPRLEINTDEVSAQHGATTGRLDDTLLFYLLSRGIDPTTARALLKWAFLSDVLRHIEIPQLRTEAERSAAGQLQDVLAVGAVT